MSKPGFNEIQGRLMEKLKELLPPHLSMADELSDLLGISNDSAYRRIRCESALSIDEVEMICKRYRISFDGLTKLDANSVSFNYSPIHSRDGINHYLESMRDEMKLFYQNPDCEITYASLDVPIFHFMKQPEYFQFKLFYWLHAITKDQDSESMKFSVKKLDPYLTALGKEMLDLYAYINSTELWADSVISSTIKQVEYCWQSGIFEDKSDATTLVEKIRLSLETVQKEAEMHVKFLSNGTPVPRDKNFFLYQSDIEMGNNTILIRMGNVYLVNATFHTYNRMFTTNYEFYKETEHWIENLKRQATLISGVAEKHRFQFFKKLYNKLDQLYEFIEKS